MRSPSARSLSGPLRRNLRRATQIIFFVLFIYLIWGNRGEPTSSGWGLASSAPPELFFLADPLTWLGGVISSRSIIAQTPIFLIILAAASLLWGRVFCGWICPLGTAIDVSGKMLRPGRLEARISRERREELHSRPLPPFFSHRVKYYLLIAIIACAILGVNISGWLDPLALLTRGMNLALAPAGEKLLESLAGAVTKVPGIQNAAISFQAWLREYVLSPSPNNYSQAFLHLGLLLFVLGLSWIRRRWWCQTLCPLGAFWGLVARAGLVRRHTSSDTCNECSICSHSCRMDAIDPKRPRAPNPSECLACQECAAVCPKNSVEFSMRRSQAQTSNEAAGIDMTRRGLLASLGAGIVAAPLLRMGSSGAGHGSSQTGEISAPLPLGTFFLRPPGARPEPKFLQMCVRCGECYRACPQNALHPALFEAGPEGLWTPRLVPRLGYCEVSCSLCTQVCPTTALEPLTPPQKQARGRLGIAVFDRARCLPWSRGVVCSVCEEMCPVSPKAIRNRKVRVTDQSGKETEVLAPWVDQEACIGCGICENKCPLEGESAVRVTRAVRPVINFAENESEST